MLKPLKKMSIAVRPLIMLCSGSAMLLLAGCTSPVPNKSVAAEAKCYGLNLSIPSTSDSTSYLSLKLGVITTRYISAPEGGTAVINSEYDDVNFWTASGTVKSNLSVSNSAKSTTVTTPVAITKESK